MVILWIIMAIVCAMVATSKRGAGTGVMFFFYGLVVWPIALTHALLMKDAVTSAIRADGFIDGKPYWSDGKSGFVARVDGRDLAFQSIGEMQTALGGEAVALEQEEELIGPKLWRNAKEKWRL